MATNTVIYIAVLLSTLLLTVDSKMMRFKMKNPCPNGINHVTFVINMFARTGLTFDGYIKHFYKTIYWPFVSKLNKQYDNFECFKMSLVLFSQQQ